MNKFVIVFDLDETLGNFTELYFFWNLLKKYLDNNNLSLNYLNIIFDKFPLFFRPKLFTLLKNLKYKKIHKYCDHIMIYTNNKYDKIWSNNIKNYINYKLNYKLFDKIIYAFKIKGITIENNRTSYEKSYYDFLNCTSLPSNTQVCFIDDKEYNYMKHPNVLYINLEPYYYYENILYIAHYFYYQNENLFNNDYIKFIKYIREKTKNNKNYIINQNYTNDKNYILINTYITEQLIKDINSFLSTKHKNFTKNFKYLKNNKTKKLK